MEHTQCPFLSKDLLSRIPESKRQEMEKYYTQLQANGGASIHDVEGRGNMPSIIVPPVA
jgi:hypothetical protein